MLARVLARRWPAYALKHPQLFSQHSIATLRTSGFEVIETVKTTNYFPLALTVFRNTSAIGRDQTRHGRAQAPVGTAGLQRMARETSLRLGVDRARLRPGASDHRHLGDGHDELASAPTELGLLGEDFGGEIPGQQEHVIRPALEQRLRRQDREVIAGRIAALLEVTAIDHELDQPPVDAEGVLRAALGGCAIRGDAMPLLLQLVQ